MCPAAAIVVSLPSRRPVKPMLGVKPIRPRLFLSTNQFSKVGKVSSRELVEETTRGGRLRRHRRNLPPLPALPSVGLLNVPYSTFTGASVARLVRSALSSLRDKNLCITRARAAQEQSARTRQRRQGRQELGAGPPSASQIGGDASL